VSPQAISRNRWKHCRILEALFVPFSNLGISYSIKPLLIKYSVSRQIASFVRLRFTSDLRRSSLLKSVYSRNIICDHGSLFVGKLFDLESKSDCVVDEYRRLVPWYPFLSQPSYHPRLCSRHLSRCPCLFLHPFPSCSYPCSFYSSVSPHIPS